MPAGARSVLTVAAVPPRAAKSSASRSSRWRTASMSGVGVSGSFGMTGGVAEGERKPSGLKHIVAILQRVGLQHQRGKRYLRAAGIERHNAHFVAILAENTAGKAR